MSLLLFVSFPLLFSSLFFIFSAFCFFSPLLFFFFSHRLLLSPFSSFSFLIFICSFSLFLVSLNYLDIFLFVSFHFPFPVYISSHFFLFCLFFFPPPGNQLSANVQRLHAEFKELMEEFQQIKFDLLDIQEKEADAHFQLFRCETLNPKP